MVGAEQIECATLGVQDRRRAVQFYTDVMGLVELENDGTTSYLGCGLDENYDLAVREGGTGVQSFALRVREGEVAPYVDRLHERGVETEKRAGTGHETGAYFELPSSGIEVGLVVVEDHRYPHAADATHFLDSTAPVADGRLPTTPLDLDHVGIIVPDVEAEVRFLEDALDFRLSDVKTDGGEWQQAFVRRGDHYHDIALFARDPQYTLHHLAWQMLDVTTMKQFADRLARHGHQLELGFLRHGPGASISIYFREPGGNRFEYSTEQPTVDADTQPGFYDGSGRTEGVSLWGGTIKPETFDEGS